MGDEPDYSKLEEIFFPFSLNEKQKIINSNNKFVHYTSAENALKIIDTREFWMRNALCMNDYSEINYGLQLLNSYFRDEQKRNKFFEVLMACGVNYDIINIVIKKFDDSSLFIRFETYVSCFSVHDTKNEDDVGRLSMWRAYGRTPARVALVLNSALFFGESDALEAYLFPVSYSDTVFFNELNNIVSNMENNRDYIKSINPGIIAECIYRVFLFGITCTKHKGFSEEQEWRVLHFPEIWKSEVLKPDVVTIDGAPQKIFKIPLADIPDEGLVGVELPSLIDRIIIGPSLNPWPIQGAFIHALMKAGVHDAAERVFVSEIPLRT
ncbi:MAG: DUF2971 domain-containing protein [Sphingomonadales bacterium]|nr:DUF2971 domain-containing protein [Sphingomonadales bacterium]